MSANQKHTPGPWKTRRGFDKDEIEVFDSVKVKRPFRRCAIATIHDNVDGKRANARLISAAPELLEACEAALRFSDRPRNSSDESELCDTLRAAIAKARGEA